MNQIHVHVDVGGTTTLVGTAYVTVRRNTLSTRFVYDLGWLASPGAWSISPDLPVHHGQATTSGLPGAFADSAPDRWGRTLIEKRHRTRHRIERTTPRSLTDVDFLLGVSDTTRQGALRFTDPDDPDTFLQPGTEVPKLIALPSLLHAARQVAGDDDDAVQLLLDAGTGSLGGARPKASVADGDRLLIAKFPHPGDTWNVMAWEATALDLAASCGIDTPPHRLVRIGENAVLLVERFDRRGTERLPYVSAMTLVGSTDGDHSDYLDVAEAITDHGSRVRHDLHELFRRIAFSLTVNNTDDHLRNHGLLRAGNGWQLAPVFDVNPNPDPGATRMTSIAGATGRADARSALIDAAEWFDLTRDRAADVFDTIRRRTRNWRDIAGRHGVGSRELATFATTLDD